MKTSGLALGGQTSSVLRARMRAHARRSVIARTALNRLPYEAALPHLRRPYSAFCVSWESPLPSTRTLTSFFPNLRSLISRFIRSPSYRRLRLITTADIVRAKEPNHANLSAQQPSSRSTHRRAGPHFRRTRLQFGRARARTSGYRRRTRSRAGAIRADRADAVRGPLGRADVVRAAGGPSRRGPAHHA